MPLEAPVTSARGRSADSMGVGCPSPAARNRPGATREESEPADRRHSVLLGHHPCHRATTAEWSFGPLLELHHCMPGTVSRSPRSRQDQRGRARRPEAAATTAETVVIAKAIGSPVGQAPARRPRRRHVRAVGEHLRAHPLARARHGPRGPRSREPPAPSATSRPPCPRLNACGGDVCLRLLGLV
jgi:hypothetical protein